MSIELKQITEKLHQSCLSIAPEKEGELHKIINLGNTYVEMTSIYIDSYAKTNDTLLESVLDEFFVDVHVSVALATGGQYKSGCVVLRAAIELSLYILYFLDHPVETKLWAESGESEKDYDMSFFQTLEKIGNPKYIKSAAGHDIDEDKITKARADLAKYYRTLSERVHGKYKFLQSTADDPNAIFKSFCESGIQSLKAILIIASERAGKSININELVPSLRSAL